MDYFEKKQWIRVVICVVLVAVITLAMTGVFSNGKQLEYAPEETAAGGSATEQGFGGDVTAHVEMNEDGTVKSVSIDTPDETDGLGKRASDAEFTGQFIGKAAPFAFGENGIEALSGATVTSAAALKAINKAAGVPGEETTEAKAEEPAREPTEEVKTEEPKTEEKTEEKKEEKAGTGTSDGQVYGSYRVSKENDYSKVTVTVGTKNGVMTSCRITSEGEQDKLTDEIRNEWAKAILESGSATPDAITGASLTFSARSVQDAAADILAQMNSEATVPAGTEEKAEAPKAGATTGEKTEATASDGQVYGSYRVTRENDYSKVTVTVGTKNGVMTSSRIASEGEQDKLTDEIRKEWAKAILESGSATPDAITGASLTFSARSVQEAMTEILAKIAGE